MNQQMLYELDAEKSEFLFGQGRKDIKINGDEITINNKYKFDREEYKQLKKEHEQKIKEEQQMFDSAFCEMRTEAIQKSQVLIGGQSDDEIVENLINSTTFDKYVNKLSRDFRQETDAKGILINQVYNHLNKYKNEALGSVETSCIEATESEVNTAKKHLFQRAYRNSKNEILENMGKKRKGKNRKWEQVISTVDDYVFINLADKKTIETALQISNAYFTESQNEFVKLVLENGVEATIKELELSKKTFNNRLNRTIRGIEKKRAKYIDKIITVDELYQKNILSKVEALITVIESEEVNDYQIFDIFLVLSKEDKNFFGLLTEETFTSGKEIEQALFAFTNRTSNARKFAYQLVNSIYRMADYTKNYI